jgi:hypothetical protein
MKTSLGGYYTSESSRHYSCNNGVNETEMAAFGAQEQEEPQEPDHTFLHSSLRHSLLELFSQIILEILCSQPPQKQRMLYGYSTLDTVPQQLANNLPAVVLAKTTIHNMCLATNGTNRRTPDDQRMFRMRLQYRLYIEMYCNLWAKYMRTFRGYRLPRNTTEVHGRIIINERDCHEVRLTLCRMQSIQIYFYNNSLM